MLRRTFLLAFFALSCGRPAEPAKTTASTTDAVGVMLMAHGGTPEWNEAVLDTVKPLRAKYPLEVAFGMADPATLQEAVGKLEARGIRKVAVVRLFVSGESFTERTEQILGIRAGAPASAPAHGDHAAHGGHGAGHAPAGHPGPADHGGHDMALYRIETSSSFALSAEGLVDAPEMGSILADRAAKLSKAPASEDVLILAHGPGEDDENARWLAKLDARTSVIRKRAPFRRVQVETLREDWPDKRAEAEKRIRAFVERAKAEEGSAIVIPFRVQGFGPYADVLKGLDYTSDGTGLIPHTEVASWIERQLTSLRTAGAFRGVVP